MRSCPDTDIDLKLEAKNNLFAIGSAFSFGFKLPGFLTYNIFHLVIFKGNGANVYHQTASLNNENKGNLLKSGLFFLYMGNKKSLCVDYVVPYSRQRRKECNIEPRASLKQTSDSN